MVVPVVGRPLSQVVFSEAKRNWPFVFGFGVTFTLVAKLSASLDRKYTGVHIIQESAVDHCMDFIGIAGDGLAEEDDVRPRGDLLGLTGRFQDFSGFMIS
uniref:Uncharacterized protein n=1 Tax=Physcomitrium patens TaxID=3218 RepID=A0A2K1KT01_PHYPA|nr:hypothetical protein PHYPA_003868 [Physcomitrium patens]